jgi:hypothetical protein
MGMAVQRSDEIEGLPVQRYGGCMAWLHGVVVYIAQVQAS